MSRSLRRSFFRFETCLSIFSLQTIVTIKTLVLVEPSDKKEVFSRKKSFLVFRSRHSTFLDQSSCFYSRHCRLKKAEESRKTHFYTNWIQNLRYFFAVAAVSRIGVCPIRNSFFAENVMNRKVENGFICFSNEKFLTLASSRKFQISRVKCKNTHS